MLHHKGFNKLASPARPKSGRRIGIAAAEMLIPSTLELGGKSANIFFDDMPFDKALEGAQKGILFNQGQVCCAGSRIFVAGRHLRQIRQRLGGRVQKESKSDCLGKTIPKWVRKSMLVSLKPF